MYAQYKDSGKTSTKPSAYTLSKIWTVERPEWSHEVARGPQTQAILNLGQAYLNFWNGKAERPCFKRKGNKQSFTIDNVKAKVNGKSVSLPNIGKVCMREEPRFEGKILSYTVSRQASGWYVSIQVEMPNAPPSPHDSVVGVDVGIKALAVASDGTTCENPMGLRKQSNKLKRIQRKLSRQVRGSNRRNKTKRRLGKVHEKITNIRQDRIHKFTTQLAKNHGTAVIETLDIQEMKESSAKWMSRNLQDTSMMEVHRQLEYKMTSVVKAPKFFASSKTCSSCGTKKPEFPCHIRTYKCERCGLVIDRDLNAAYNLQRMPWVTGSKCAEPRPGQRSAKR
jgi:putative transposase